MYACWMCFVQCVCVCFFGAAEFFFRFVSFFIISVICSHFFCLIFFSFSFVAVKIFSILMVLKFTLFSFPLQIKTSYTRNFFFSIIPHIKYEPKKKSTKMNSAISIRMSTIISLLSILSSCFTAITLAQRSQGKDNLYWWLKLMKWLKALNKLKSLYGASIKKMIVLDIFFCFCF